VETEPFRSKHGDIGNLPFSSRGRPKAASWRRAGTFTPGGCAAALARQAE
jgi:hypothetical protein